VKQIATLFDISQYPFEPLRSVVIDNDLVKEYIFFEKGSGLTLKKINQNIADFKQEFNSECCVNDFLAHLKTFKLDLHLRYNVYDKILPKIDHREIVNKADFVLKVAISFRNGAVWEKLRAQASVVYKHLENRGVKHYKVVHPRYSLDTTTGRSKTTGFNIQGTTDDDHIFPVDSGDLYFIHFDWTSADVRIASHMSKDMVLERSFKDSDPYTFVANFLKQEDMSRDLIKKRFLSSFYSLNFDDPIFDLFPTFRKYMHNRLIYLEKNGYVESLLGRKFKLKGDNKLSAFNAPFQGGVAHAMQASLVEIYKHYPMNLFTEVHDSIIMISDRKSIGSIVRNVSSVMLCPLRSYFSNAPVMPLKVSVGKKWRSWKLLRVYKDEQR
jgi:hypothetical protein